MIALVSILMGVGVLLATMYFAGADRVRNLAGAYAAGSGSGFWDHVFARLRDFPNKALMKDRDSASWEEAAFSLAFHLRAGEPLAQALRAVAEEGEGFAQSCLMKAYRRYEAGASLHAALSDTGSHIPEMSYLAGIFEVGLASGGDLPSLLCHASEALRRRRLLQKEASAKLVEARLTAYLLAVLPWVVAFATFRQDPGLWQNLAADPRARTLVLAGLVLWAAGNMLVIWLIRSAVPRVRYLPGSTEGGGRR